MWPDRYKDSSPSGDAAFNLPEGPRALFMGDAVTRALSANALAGNGPAKPDANWAAPYLLEAFTDRYPIVRFFAANGLKSNFKDMPKPDYLGTPSAREATANEWRNILNAGSLSQARQLADAMRKQRKEVDLEVGE